MKIKDIIVKNSLITIILDDDSEYILHIDVFSFSNITRTSDVTKSNLIKLVNDSKFYFCKDYLMNQISKYTKTEKGYYTKLIEKNFPKEESIKAIKYAKDKGYINDSEYAKRYYNANKNRKSKKKIEYELRAKGINSNLLTFLEEENDDISSIILLAKRYTKNKELTKELKVKTIKHLLSKGYSYGLVKDAVNTIFNSDDE